MSDQKLFVLAITPMGPWLGTTTEENYTAWKSSNGALHLSDPRGLQIIPMYQQQTKFGVQIGNPYVADTHQKNLDVCPVAVELLGRITSDNAEGQDEVDDHKALFNNYTDAVTKWRAAMSNLTIADPSDISNLGNLRTVK